MHAIPKLTLLLTTAVLCSCGKREATKIYQSFDPGKAVVSAGFPHGLNLTSTGEGESWNTGYGEKDWSFFSGDEGDKLVDVVEDIRDEFRAQLEKDGATIHGTGEYRGSFVSYSLRYKLGARRGVLEIIGARLREGTGVEVRLRETP